MKKILMLLVMSISILACSNDPNSKPEYGSDSGLPSNCRSYVQVSVDSWRASEYETEEIMNALERNCGISGHLWD